MRKIRSKLKRKSSNFKWKRGHSSTSNPTKTVHRDRARAKGLSNTGGNTNLTAEAVNKLNKINSNKNKDAAPGNMCIDDSESMYSNAPTTTVRSFMSSFSTNTNASFSKLLDCQNLDKRRKKMVAVLAASVETINEQKGGETSTEYFMAFINSLAIVEEIEKADPIIGLVRLVIRSVPKAVLQDKFLLARGVFMKLMETFEASEQQSGLIDVISCTSTLLSAQDFDKWNSHAMLTLLQAVLSFTIHSKPKIRKCAVNSITYVLQQCALHEASEMQDIHFVPSKKVTSYCLEFFSATHLSGNSVTLLHILGLIERCFPYVTAEDTKVICEALLSLCSCSNPIIRMHCYQALYTLFEAEKCSLTHTLAGQLISAIFDLQPDTSDVRQTVAWITVLKKGYYFMAKKNIKICGDMLPRFMQLLINELWPKSQSEISNTVTITLKDLLNDVMTELVKENGLKKQVLTILQSFIAALKNPFALCNKQVIILFATVYEVYGKDYSPELQESLNMFGSRYNPEGEDRREIENTILSAIKYVDVAVVLKAIPLTGADGEMSIDHSWMLPLLREGLRNSSLEYFYTNIIPLASVCLKKWKNFESAGKKSDSHIYELLCCQLWGLFPGFCRHPRDCEKFSLIARTAGMLLNENLYLRAPILDGFKELIPSVIAAGKQESVGKYVKNYLPILFNLYITKPKGSYENDLRVSVLDIIKLFLKITPNETLNEMFNSVFNRLKNTKEGDFAYNMLFDIIECFAVYLKPEHLNILYDEYIKPIFKTKGSKENENGKLKVKKAYRVICNILSNDNESCQQFVLQRKNELEELLIKSEKLNGDNVMLTRLKCLKYLIKIANLNSSSELVRQCVTETVLCFPNNPEKPNQLCIEMIQTLGTAYSNEGKFDEFIELILFGFTSDATDLIIKTIWSVNTILQIFSSNIDSETLSFVLDNLYASVQSNHRIEAKSALCTLYTFCKHISRAVLKDHLEPLVKAISKMTSDTKRFCRLPFGHLLKKLCQYYSAQEIIKLVPGNDLVTHKRLKKIRKELGRTKNQTNARNNNVEDDDDEMDIDQKLKTITINDVLNDSDESDSDDDEEAKEIQKKEMKTKNNKVFIREEGDTIVDLSDVNAISQVSFKNKSNNKQNKPKEPVDEDDKISFRTAPDGRLIIEEPKRSKALKPNLPVKRARESDASDSDSDDENVSHINKGKPGESKNKKIMRTHKNGSSAASVASSKKSLKLSKIARSTKSSSDKKLKKEWNSNTKQHMQPYAYLPFSGPHKKKNK